MSTNTILARITHKGGLMADLGDKLDALLAAHGPGVPASPFDYINNELARRVEDRFRELGIAVTASPSLLGLISVRVSESDLHRFKLAHSDDYTCTVLLTPDQLEDRLSLAEPILGDWKSVEPQSTRWSALSAAAIWAEQHVKLGAVHSPAFRADLTIRCLAPVSAPEDLSATPVLFAVPGAQVLVIDTGDHYWFRWRGDEASFSDLCLQLLMFEDALA